MATKEELLQKLSDCVFEMEDEEVVDVVKEYIEAGFDAQEGMLLGLVDGMKRASAMYEEGEYFVPELIICSDAMYAGIEELQKYLPNTEGTSAGKI
ncbi:MAG: B12-binding domain-containing protein, partial [bacterium]|nr:B12-binding domain-containing protein [bacterium]